MSEGEDRGLTEIEKKISNIMGDIKDFMFKASKLLESGAELHLDLIVSCDKGVRLTHMHLSTSED